MPLSVLTTTSVATAVEAAADWVTLPGVRSDRVLCTFHSEVSVVTRIPDPVYGAILVCFHSAPCRLSDGSFDVVMVYISDTLVFVNLLEIFVCMCVCVCACVYVYMYVCMYM